MQWKSLLKVCFNNNNPQAPFCVHNVVFANVYRIFFDTGYMLIINMLKITANVTSIILLVREMRQRSRRVLMKSVDDIQAITFI